jgi:hypothetical protein
MKKVFVLLSVASMFAFTSCSEAPVVEEKAPEAVIEVEEVATPVVEEAVVTEEVMTEEVVTEDGEAVVTEEVVVEDGEVVEEVEEVHAH